MSESVAATIEPFQEALERLKEILSPHGIRLEKIESMERTGLGSRALKVNPLPAPTVLCTVKIQVPVSEWSDRAVLPSSITKNMR